MVNMAEFASMVTLVTEGKFVPCLELRHPRCVCNKKLQCKEVKTQQVDL